MTAPARWLEDFNPGDVAEFGDTLVTEQEVIAFAKRYDPQPFHVDAEAAAASSFGGLVASGWHTSAMMMRMLVDHWVPQQASMGSPGVDELRWLKPVRPGARLSVRLTVLDTTRSRSKPDRGVVRTLTEVLNQQGEVVMSARSIAIVRVRLQQPR